MYNIRKTITGEPNITIQDGTDTSLVGCNIEGNSYQYTTIGKNLYRNSDTFDGNASAGWNVGGTVDIAETKDGSYSSRTTSAWGGPGVNFKQLYENGKIDVGDTVTYSVYFKTNFVPNNTPSFSFTLYRAIDGSLSVKTFLADEITPNEWYRISKTFEITDFTITQTNARIELNYYDSSDPYYFGNNRENYVWYSQPQIEKSDVLTDYEPYTGMNPSPSPDYPQDIEVVEGINLCNGINQNVYLNQAATSTGIASDNSGLYIKVNGGKYTISTTISQTRYRVACSNIEPPSVGTTTAYNGQNKDGTSNSITIDTTGYTYLIINATDLSKIQVEKGSTANEYIPYNNIGVNVIGKNLLNTSLSIIKAANNSGTWNNNVYTWNEVTFTVNSDLSITIGGTYSQRAYFYLCGYTNIRPNVYTLSGCPNGGSNNTYWLFSDILDGTTYVNNAKDTGSGASVNLSSYSNPKISCYIDIRSSSAIGKTFYPMLRLSSVTDVSYEPYTSITTSIDLQDNFIGKIGSIKDELNIDDLGNVILTKRIGKASLDNTNYVERGTTGTNAYYLGVNIQTPTDNNAILCMSNMFQPISFANRNNGLDVTYSQNGYVKLRTANNTSINWSDATNCKNWLDTNKPVVYYVLATPYTVNLGKVNIELNEGTNYITFLTNLDTRNTIEYGSDTSAFREQSYSGESLYKADLRIYHNEEENIIDMEQIARITIKDPIIDTTSSVFYLGSFIAKSITIKFKNLDGIDITSGDKVTLQIAQTINNEDIYIPIGEFYIDDLAENYQTTCEIVCNDASVKFKQAVDYSSCFGDEDTATIDTILQEICDICGVPLGKYPTINGDLVVGVYDGSISGKQWVSYIAELKGCNAKIDRYGRLSLIPLKQSSRVSINALESKDWNLGEKYTISQVRYYNGSIWYESPVDPENDDNVLYIRNDNPFIDSNTTLDNIYDLVADCEIYNVKTQNYGDITLDAYDNITYNLDGDSYQTLNDNTIVYEMSVMATVEYKISTNQQEKTTNVILGDQNTQMKMLKTTVDLVNAKVTTTASEVSTINQKFDGYVTTGTFTTLQNTVNTIQTSTYTKTEVGQILKGEYTDEQGNKVQVTKAVTESGTFSNEGLRIQKEDENGNVISKTSGLFNELGVDIKRTSDNQNVLYAGMVDENDNRFSGYEGQTIVGTENVIVKTYLVMGDKSRFEDYEYATGKHATGCYWIGD